MNISNKSNRPIKVPLPQGKSIFLGPGKSGQVNPKAQEHAGFKKLVDAGDIEITDGGRTSTVGTGGANPRSTKFSRN